MLNKMFHEDVTLNVIGGEFFSYIDLKHKKIVLLHSSDMPYKVLLRIPFREELYPYGMAMFDYLNDRDIAVPRGNSAKHYLHEKGLLVDFYAFYNEHTDRLFEEWLEEIEFMVS